MQRYAQITGLQELWYYTCTWFFCFCPVTSKLQECFVVCLLLSYFHKLGVNI